MVSTIHGIIAWIMDSVRIGAIVLAGVMDSMILSTTLVLTHGIQAIMDILIVMEVGMILGIQVIMDTHIMVEDKFLIAVRLERETILLIMAIIQVLLLRALLVVHAQIMEVDLQDITVLGTEVLERKTTHHVLEVHVP